MYIAIVDSQVVEHQDDLREVYERAKRRFPSKEVVLWKVPREELLIHELDYLRTCKALFERIIVPRAVYEEILGSQRKELINVSPYM